MDDDFIKRKYGVLIEELWREVKIVKESNRRDKNKIINEFIEYFYQEYKEELGIKSQDEIKRRLADIDNNMKKAKERMEKDER